MNEREALHGPGTPYMSSTAPRVRAGTQGDIRRESGDWVFIDVGFSQAGRTSGLLVNGGEPKELTFAHLRSELVATLIKLPGITNLVFEAPLSAAFTKVGNPTGRSIERNGIQHRYWYEGAGCQVTLSAAYLLRAVIELPEAPEIRLFEGFASFKERGKKSSHAGDTKAIRSVAWNEPGASGRIVEPAKLCVQETDRLESAFRVFGFDCGIPAVIMADI